MARNKTGLRKRLTHIWEPPHFEETFANSKRQTWKKGNILFHQGDMLEKVIYIKHGFIKEYQLSSEGKHTVNYLYGPGYILGIRALFTQNGCVNYTAEAITDVHCGTLSRDTYIALIENHPEYLIDLIYVFADRLAFTEGKAERFIITDTTARVANFIADCARRFGIKEKNSILLPVTLTHQRIAEFVGSYRETITLAINRLEKDGSIHMARGGKVTICNKEMLLRNALLENNYF